ncbi:MAG: KdsC family phosphatase [Bacteroidota bacterium]|jgi:YrbI family 3-deoxy-D-manno-octulosonate 8-phosphate phosphatase
MSWLPKLVLTDIDGVWTDGGMYYDQTGNEFKKFTTSDSAGVLFLRQLNIETGIITGENTEIVARRAAKLKISILHQGISNKLACAQQICAERGISLNDVAYIGDDIGDVQLLNAVGFSSAPLNAQLYIRNKVHYVTQLKGGEGAFRDFAETILQRAGKLDEVINQLTGAGR